MYQVAAVFEETLTIDHGGRRISGRVLPFFLYKGRSRMFPKGEEKPWVPVEHNIRQEETVTLHATGNHERLKKTDAQVVRQ
jgi:hypothetical protein